MDRGHTLVELIVAMVIISICVIYAMTDGTVHYREAAARASLLRSSDQYANNLIETITHSLRNCNDIKLLRTNRFDIKFQDGTKESWKLDKGQVYVNNHLILDGYEDGFSIANFELVESPGTDLYTFKLTMEAVRGDWKKLRSYSTTIYLKNKVLTKDE